MAAYAFLQTLKKSSIIPLLYTLLYSIVVKRAKEKRTSVSHSIGKTIDFWIFEEMVIQQFGEKNRNLAVKEGKNASVGLAAWCVSNCPTYYSGREDFIEKLKLIFMGPPPGW